MDKRGKKRIKMAEVPIMDKMRGSSTSSSPSDSDPTGIVIRAKKYPTPSGSQSQQTLNPDPAPAILAQVPASNLVAEPESSGGGEVEPNGGDVEPDGGDVEPDGGDPAPVIPSQFAQAGNRIREAYMLKGPRLFVVDLVNGPTSFVMLTSSSSSKRDKLVANMTLQYEHRIKENPGYAKINQALLSPGLCVAILKDQNWLRAKVVQGESNMRMVQTVDYGVYTMISVSNIRYLAMEYIIERACAISCVLCDYKKFPEIRSRQIRPNNYVWGSAAVERFFELVKPGERFNTRLAEAGKTGDGKWIVELKCYVEGRSPIDIRYIHVAQEMLMYQWWAPRFPAYSPITSENDEDYQESDSSTSASQ